MKEIDYPAGHSMDTNWFAVDKNGDIGFFDTGQEGAYPIQVKAHTLWHELFFNYTIPVTKGLKQLFLDENTVKQLLGRCTTGVLEKITKAEEYWDDGYIVLLSEGKTWEDLHFEEDFAKSEEDFALLLSPSIPIYLLCNVYVIQKKLVAAVENGIIYKACEFSIYPEEGSDDRVAISELGVCVYENENYGIDPYERLYDSNIPVNISLFNNEKSHEIPKFSEIVFSEQRFIQPMAFFSCCSDASARSEDDIPRNLIEEGYVKVKLSDEEWAYCLLPVSDLMWFKMDLGRCHKCYDVDSIRLYHASLDSLQDYPPVLLIRDYYNYRNVKCLEYSDISDCLSKCVEINKYDCYLSYCVKCHNDKNEDFERQFTKESLELRFQKCHGHFEVEIDTLQPLLLITLEEGAKNLIHQCYQISNLAEAPCLCSVSIKGKTYPLLVVNDMKTAEDNEKLMRYLKTVSGEINTILGKQRDLPALKPRVIRIDESSQPVPDQ
jgi:hypothetical protein